MHWESRPSYRGLLLREGTIMDATMVQASPSTKEPGSSTGSGDGLSTDSTITDEDT